MSLILPSYQSGFAPRDYEPAYPSLWQGCVAAYAPLLGPTGLVLRDSVGKNDGVLTGGPTYQISNGRYALDFDGVDDWVDLGNVLGFAGSNQTISISWWAYLKNANDQMRPFSKCRTTSTNSGWEVASYFDAGVYYVYWFSANALSPNRSFVQAVASGSASQWRHYAVTFHAALGTSAGTKIYENTTLLTNQVLESGSTTIAANALTAKISASDSTASPGTPTGFTPSILDDIRIYNRILSPSEVQLLASRRGISYEPKRTRKWYFRGFSPKKKLLEAKITSTVPGSYQTGYAPRDGEPVYPELWKGCVGAWSAGLGPSNILRDNSPAKNHGSLVNGPTYQVSGGQYAINMDGTDDYVSAAQSVSLTDGVVTVSGWMRRTGTPDQNNAVVFAKGTLEGNANSTCALYWNEIQGWSWFVVDAANNLTIVRSNTVTTLNQWVHVCGVASSAGLRLYLNGVLANSTTGASLKNSTQQSTLGGASGGAIFTSLRGQLDDVRVYNRELSISEIKTLATRRNIAYEYKRPRTLFRAYDPIKQVGVGKITSIIPGGYHTGVGGVNNEPAYPELTKGLIGGWCPSLGVTGGLLRDNSGQGNHGTLTGMDPGTDWVVSGGKYALDFDGSNDAVEVTLGNLSTVFNSNIFSFSTWAYVRSFSNSPVLATAQTLNASVDDFLVEANNTGSQIYVKAVDNAGGLTGARTYTLSTALSINQWFHVVFIKSGTGDNGLLYVNGKLETSYTGTLSDSVTESTQVLRLGRYGSSTAPLNGQLDDIRLYNRILTPNEIRLLASRRGIGYDFKTHRSYSKTQSSGLRKRILTGLP